MGHVDSIKATPVAMDYFKVVSLSIADLESDTETATPRLHAEFNRNISEDGERALLKSHMVIDEENLAYYSIDIQAECQFGFQPGLSEDEVDDYLSMVGATRLMDAMRQYLAQATTPFSLGPIAIPALTPVVNWVKDDTGE